MTMLSESLLQVEQHLMLLGYTIVAIEDDAFVAQHPQHKVLVAEDVNFIYLMSTFTPRDFSDITVSNLMALANYGNQKSAVTRFFVGEDRNFVAWVLYAKPYDMTRFGQVLGLMRGDILRLATSQLIAYLK